MIQLGIIGWPLQHTQSPAYFDTKFKKLGIKGQYLAFSIEDISQLPEIIGSHPDLIGFNVTHPYKEVIIPYLSELSPEAEVIGAVNTVKIIRLGNAVTLTGYNTDYYGFAESLKPCLGQRHHNTGALILGTGGAAKAVAYALTSLGIPFVAVSRNVDTDNYFVRHGHNVISYDELTADIMSRHCILINCTPLGMHPHEGECPDIPWVLMPENALCYDLVYNPPLTPFMTEGARHGAAVKNGLEMLHLQAEGAWKIWNR